MKRIPIDECPAGVEIDAAVEVARNRPGQFFDYVFINGKRCDIATWIPEGFTPEQPPAGSRAGQMPPQYSTDIAAAWKLAINPPESSDHVAVYLLSVSQNITGDWWARFGNQLGTIACTVPLAITRAYLKAKGIEFVEVEE